MKSAEKVKVWKNMVSIVHEQKKYLRHSISAEMACGLLPERCTLLMCFFDEINGLHKNRRNCQNNWQGVFVTPNRPYKYLSLGFPACPAQVTKAMSYISSRRPLIFMQIENAYASPISPRSKVRLRSREARMTYLSLLCPKRNPNARLPRPS
jgi:hypothetical protein